MANDGPSLSREPRPLALASIAVTVILLSGFLGGTINVVNGAVSPRYFVNVLQWNGVENVWRASVAQGIFEGLLFGILFSIVFTITTGLITGTACTFGFAFRHLLGILAGTYACWVLGGLLAMGLATLSPEFYARTFFGVPQGPDEMRAYAWVGGSIWGAQFGGMVSLIVGLVILRANWLHEGEGEDLPRQDAALRQGQPPGAAESIQAERGPEW